MLMKILVRLREGCLYACVCDVSYRCWHVLEEHGVFVEEE